MSTSSTTMQHGPVGRIGRRAMAFLGAAALTVVLSGTVAAAALERDGADPEDVFVTPVPAAHVDATDWLAAKAATHNGYTVLASA